MMVWLHLSAPIKRSPSRRTPENEGSSGITVACVPRYVQEPNPCDSSACGEFSLWRFLGALFIYTIRQPGGREFVEPAAGVAGHACRKDCAENEWEEGCQRRSGIHGFSWFSGRLLECAAAFLSSSNCTRMRSRPKRPNQDPLGQRTRRGRIDEVLNFWRRGF